MTLSGEANNLWDVVDVEKESRVHARWTDKMMDKRENHLFRKGWKDKYLYFTKDA